MKKHRGSTATSGMSFSREAEEKENMNGEDSHSGYITAATANNSGEQLEPKVSDDSDRAQLFGVRA